MAKVYDHQVTVRVWRNVKTLGKIPTGHFGHAAVTITGISVPGFEQHISFWPGAYASKGMSAIRKQDGDWTGDAADDKVAEMNRLTAVRLEVGYCQAHKIPYPSLYDDILEEFKKTPLANPRPGQRRLGITDNDNLPLWSQSPESKVVLPGLGASGRVWGLSTRRMGLWWKEFQDGDPYYQALGKQNCAGVALMGLDAGGAGAFAPSPPIRIYGEPRQVERYADQLEHQMDRMETWSTQLDDAVKQAVVTRKLDPRPSTNLSDGLWKPETWKKESALGPTKPRSSLIREIDAALARYHAADWGDGFRTRYAALVALFLGIVKHRRSRPDSGRGKAVLRLGSQVLAVARNVGPIR